MQYARQHATHPYLTRTRSLKADWLHGKRESVLFVATVCGAFSLNFEQREIAVTLKVTFSIVIS